MNPLSRFFGSGQPALPGKIGNILSQFQQFRNSFRGDPQQQIQQMLNSGQINQNQVNQAIQMAQGLQKYLQ